MNKRNDIIFVLTFMVVVGLTLVYMFQTSYAKYRRQTNADVEGEIASWNIKVNNESINTQATLTNTITPTIDTNPNVKAGKIAPGSTGYFDLIIDATDVDVNFTYTITGEVDEETPLTDLVLNRYSINGGTAINYNGTTGITGDIPMNTSQTTIRVYFEWNDDATNQMNNQEDTEYALDADNSNTKINVSIHFQQKNS